MSNTNKERIAVEHPGIFLKEDFLEPLNISEYRLAKDIDVPPRRINEIVKGKRSITPDTALRLERYFNYKARLWLGLQAAYDLDQQENNIAEELSSIHIHKAA